LWLRRIPALPMVLQLFGVSVVRRFTVSASLRSVAPRAAYLRSAFGLNKHLTLQSVTSGSRVIHRFPGISIRLTPAVRPLRCRVVSLSIIDNTTLIQTCDAMVLRQFVLGFVRVHTLHHAAEEPIYGTGMIEELETHGYEMSPGTIYPILHDLEDEDLLESEKRVVDGRERKYYRATEEGRETLEEIKDKIRELTDEVL